MQMLYDSDSFVVVHLQANEPGEGEALPPVVRHGFEPATVAQTTDRHWTWRAVRS